MQLLAPVVRTYLRLTTFFLLQRLASRLLDNISINTPVKMTSYFFNKIKIALSLKARDRGVRHIGQSSIENARFARQFLARLAQKKLLDEIRTRRNNQWQDFKLLVPRSAWNERFRQIQPPARRKSKGAAYDGCSQNDSLGGIADDGERLRARRANRRAALRQKQSPL